MRKWRMQVILFFSPAMGKAKSRNAYDTSDPERMEAVKKSTRKNDRMSCCCAGLKI